MTLIVDALAVARLTRLLTTDRIGRGVRNRIERVGSAELTYWVQCDWCSSFGIAMVVVVARRMVPRVWDPLARALAFSEIAGVIASTT